jgi:glutathione peroxidase
MSLLDISVRRIDGRKTSLAEFKGKVLLIVNVASKCGLTPQYEGLEKVYVKYRDHGLVVVGFPANQFAGQEPGANAEIQEFCHSTYGVDFPMFEKIIVKGEGQHPLYKFLTKALPRTHKKVNSKLEQILKELGLLSDRPSDIMWNFEKFLIGRNGQIVARFAPDIEPSDPILLEVIERELWRA